jgi:hypothetical protein
VNLTIPVECLVPVDIISNTDIGRHTIFELNQLLVSGKEAFVDSRSTRAVMDYMRQVLEKVIVSLFYITVLCGHTYFHIDSFTVMVPYNSSLKSIGPEIFNRDQ